MTSLYTKVVTSVQDAGSMYQPAMYSTKKINVNTGLIDTGNHASGDDSCDSIFDVKPVKSNLDKIPPNPHWEIVGRHPFRFVASGITKCGKTTLVRHLYTYFWADYFDKIYVWSPNFELDSTWRDLKRKVDKYFLKLDESDIVSIVEANRTRIKMAGMEHSDKILMIFDDQASEENIRFNKEIERLATRGRHDNISFVFSTQQYNRVPKTIRINCSMFALFKTMNNEEMEDIIKELRCPLLTPSAFKEMFYDATSVRFKGFLLINVDKPLKEVYSFGLKTQVVLKDYDEQKKAAQEEQIKEKMALSGGSGANGTLFKARRIKKPRIAGS